MAKSPTVARKAKAARPSQAASTTSAAAQAPLPREFRRLKLERVAPSKTLNTRAAITNDSVRELANSMASQGLLQPIVVGELENGQHPILAGRRRLAAAKLLGWNEIDACVLDGGTARALEVLVVENDQRVGPDPMIESEIVAKLLEREGWGYREAAAALGKSEGWVARRAALHNLSPEVRKLVAEEAEDGLDGEWPIAWLEELAMLAPAAQREIAEAGKPWNMQELRQRVREYMGSLGAAPWALEDADLDRIAGACSSCTKHTAAVPSLFPEEKSIHVLAKALCLDRVCYGNKRARHIERTIAAAAEKSADTVVIAEEPDEDGPEPARFVAAEAAGLKTVAPGTMVAAKKTDKGAVPVVYATGMRAGETGWARPAPKSSPRSRVDGDDDEPRGRVSVARPMTMGEKRKALELRRCRHVYSEFRTELEQLVKSPTKLTAIASDMDDEQALQLVAAFGTLGYGERDLYSTTPTSRTKLVEGGAKAVRTRVVKAVLQGAIENRGAFSPYNGQGDHATAAADTVEAFLRIWPLGADYKSRVKNAAAALPEPKSWEGDKKRVKVLAISKARKGTLRAKRKAARK